MASKVLTFSVVLKAINLLSGPVRDALRALEDVERVGQRTKGLRQMAQDLDAVGGALQKIGAAGVGVGLGGAYALGLHEVPGQAVRAEYALRQIGNTADLTHDQIAAAGAELPGLTRQTNQYQDALLDGLGLLAAAGLEFNTSLAALRPIGRTATGEVADLNAVAATSFALIDNLKVPVAELQLGLDALAQSGKEGRFELADMALYFPVITASAQQLKMTGVPAVASLGAALQVAMKGAGDPSQAATNFQNFLSKLTAPDTVRRFKELGIDLQREFALATQAGKDPIMEFLQLIQRVSGGDPFKMGEMFGDQQVLNFLRPMLANLKEYERIRASALQSKGVVDRDYINMLTTTSELWKALRLNMAASFGPLVQGPLRLVNSVLVQLNSNPGLQQLILDGVLLATAVGGLTLGMGTLLVFAGAALNATATLANGAAALRAGWMGATAGLEGGMAIMGAAGGRMRSLARRAAGVGTALLDVVRMQKLTNAIAYRGGFFNLLRFQALRARYAVLENVAALRLWTRTQLRAGGAAVISLFRLGTWTGALGKARGFLRMTTLAVRGFSLALLTNPITWVAVAVVGAALLIFKYWRPIAGFFRGLWSGLLEGLGSVLPVIAQLFAPLRPVIGWIGSLISWVGRILKPVDDVGGAAENLGVRWGRVVGGIMAAVLGLPAKMFSAGVRIMTELWRGLKAAASQPVSAALDVANRVGRFLIGHSPPPAGPLRRLDRVGWMETIAATIHPAPVVSAMRGATAAVMMAAAAPPALAQVRPAPLLSPAAETRFRAAATDRRTPIATSAGAPPQISLHYAPVYHVGRGADSDLVTQIKQANREQGAELERMVQQIVDRANRMRDRARYTGEG